jgi:hypothetical protein
LYITLIGLSLVIGIAGYHFTENYSLIDSLLNSAMIMGGMGQINALQTVGGKIFASFYASYCGLAELIGAAILLTPIAHRLLHSLRIVRPKEEEIKAEEHREEKKIEKGEKPGIV